MDPLHLLYKLKMDIGKNKSAMEYTTQQKKMCKYQKDYRVYKPTLEEN